MDLTCFLFNFTCFSSGCRCLAHFVKTSPRYFTNGYRSHLLRLLGCPKIYQLHINQPACYALVCDCVLFECLEGLTTPLGKKLSPPH